MKSILEPWIADGYSTNPKYVCVVCGQELWEEKKYKGQPYLEDTYGNRHYKTRCNLVQADKKGW